MLDTEARNQILKSHAGLIHRVVMHISHPGSVPDLEQILLLAEENGWERLAAVLRDLMTGKRGECVPPDLDDEEQVVVSAVLLALDDPGSLPELPVDLGSAMTATGIAGLVFATRNGNDQARQILGSVTNQMMQSGADFSVLVNRIGPLMEGERDPVQLTQGMWGQDKGLMLEIIDELLKLEADSRA